MKFYPIETERLVLRDFCERDIVDFSTYRGNPEVAKYQSWSNFTIEEGTKFYENQRTRAFNDVGTWYQIGISKKNEEKLIGDLAVHFFEESQVEVGFTLSQSAQGHGYAKEALSALIENLFCMMNKHRIVATIDTRNGSAKKLLESLHFRQEGHYLKNIFFKGAWSDEYFYALLRDELR